MTSARRALVHREVARAMAARRRSDPLAVAFHARRGGDDELAARSLVEAAERRRRSLRRRHRGRLAVGRLCPRRRSGDIGGESTHPHVAARSRRRECRCGDGSRGRGRRGCPRDGRVGRVLPPRLRRGRDVRRGGDRGCRRHRRWRRLPRVVGQGASRCRRSRWCARPVRRGRGRSAGDAAGRRRLVRQRVAPCRTAGRGARPRRARIAQPAGSAPVCAAPRPLVADAGARPPRPARRRVPFARRAGSSHRALGSARVALPRAGAQHPGVPPAQRQPPRSGRRREPGGARAHVGARR